MITDSVAFFNPLGWVNRAGSGRYAEHRCRWQTLIDGLRYAHDHAGRADRPLEILLTTNGLGLTSERLDALATLPVMIQFSLDGDAAGSRFRRGLDRSADEAWTQTWEAVQLLLDHEVPWFMNATLPLAAAAEVENRHAWAREVGLPALQLNYATGMAGSAAQTQTYLTGLARVLAHHQDHPDGLALFNWQNGADPAPLCGDMIVDVDGLVYQVGALFHERRSPAFKRTYRIGHVDQETTFTGRRWTLRELAERTREALADDPRQCDVFFDNVRLGAAVELVVEAARSA